MKKTLIALAALAATSSFAQVTISGLMNMGITYNSAVAAGANTIGAGSGNNNRIAFASKEDLGGGLNAVANMQLRFDPTTGGTEASGARPLFQGETRVGLTGDFGTILLGRGLTALQAPNGGVIDPWGVSTVAGSVYAPGFASDYAAGSEGRLEGVFYTSPVIGGGFQVGVSFSPVLTKGTGSGANSYSAMPYSTALTYMAGPVQAVIGYEMNRSADTLLNVGANYDLGAAKLYVGYGMVRGGSAGQRVTTAFAAASSAYPSAAAGNTVGTGAVAVDSTNTAWSLGAAIPMGNTLFRVGYSNFGSDLAGTTRDSKIGLGAQFNMSKRTFFYTDLASTTRNNNVAGNDPATNRDNRVQFDLGIQHSF